MERIRLMLLLAAGILLCACSDDDDDNGYPSVITSLVDVQTDAGKKVKSITTDDGQTYEILNQELSTNYADTVLRCLGVFELDTVLHTANVYSLQGVISYKPRIYEDFSKLPHEAVKIISSWKSSRYYNLQISYLTTGNGAHAFGFSEDSIVVTPFGVKTAFISLLHQRPEGDAASYSQKAFVSLPLFLYEGKVDSLLFRVNTTEGIREWGTSFQ